MDDTYKRCDVWFVFSYEMCVLCMFFFIRWFDWLVLNSFILPSSIRAAAAVSSFVFFSSIIYFKNIYMNNLKQQQNPNDTHTYWRIHNTIEWRERRRMSHNFVALLGVLCVSCWYFYCCRICCFCSCCCCSYFVSAECVLCI